MRETGKPLGTAMRAHTLGRAQLRVMAHGLVREMAHGNGLLVREMVHGNGLLVREMAHGNGLLVREMVHGNGLLVREMAHGNGLLVREMAHGNGLLVREMAHGPGRESDCNMGSVLELAHGLVHGQGRVYMEGSGLERLLVLILTSSAWVCRLPETKA